MTDTASAPIRWGILATGGIAAAFASDLLLHGHTVTAVASRTAESAERFAREHGIGRAHASYEALYADPEVDVIYVATPHPWHARNAVAALDAGKHVLVEKPFALTGAEAAAIADAARRNGRFAMEAMWTRFLPHMRRIADIVQGGELGRVTSVVADHTQDLPRDPSHRLVSKELGGGALLDLGIYPISFANQLLGAPVAVAAAGVLNSEGTDSQVGTSTVHADGAMASTFSSAISAGATRAAVHGEQGRIEIDQVWYSPTSFRWFGADGALREHFTSEVTGRGMQYQAAHVEEQLRAGSLDSPILPLAESVQIMELLDEVRALIGVDYDA
jgi:predicted dehydrogenase